MTTDFDCPVSGNLCTNHGGTADDSWSGTLDAGDHKIVVYPYGGGSGNYTLTIGVQAPSTGGSTGTETRVTTLVDVSRTGVSTGQTHGFTLSGTAEVEVALTGLTIDFDCRVGSSRCTNRWGTLDDSWSDDLAAGNHSVVVYPYDPGPGDYSLTVTATETVTYVATPLAGGPPRIVVLLCEEEDGIVIEGSCIEVVIPLGGQGDGYGGDGGDGGGGGGGGGDDDRDGGTDPADDAIDACYASSLVNSERVSSNPLEDNRALGSDHGGRNTARPSHRGIDVRASRGDAVMAPVSGRVTETGSGHGTNAWDPDTRTFATTYPPNGNFVRIVDSAGREHVFLHLHTVGVEVEDTVAAFQQIGTANNSGNSRGDHMHYTIWRDSSRQLELNGKFASREFTEVLGQTMTVTTVISSEGLRISDDRGGSRTEAYRRFPLDACDRGSVGDELEHHGLRTRPGGCVDPALFAARFDEASDDHGTIAEVVRDSQGLPIGVRFGESLLLR